MGLTCTNSTHKYGKQPLVVPPLSLHFFTCISRSAVLNVCWLRSILALDKDVLLPINVSNSTQPCNTFGLHPQLTNLQKLWNEGDASAVANVGAMVEPVTKAEYNAGSKVVPDGLFSHNVSSRCLVSSSECPEYRLLEGAQVRVTGVSLGSRCEL